MFIISTVKIEGKRYLYGKNVPTAETKKNDALTLYHSLTEKGVRKDVFEPQPS